MSEVTRILSAIEHGDPHAAEELLPLVYDELRRLAAQKLAQETPGQTLQATALVHEAYTRLVAGGETEVATSSSSKLTRCQSPPCFSRALLRARSIRIRRMASAAAAKKWPRLFQSWFDPPASPPGLGTSRR